MNKEDITTAHNREPDCYILIAFKLSGCHAGSYRSIQYPDYLWSSSFSSS